MGPQAQASEPGARVERETPNGTILASCPAACYKWGQFACLMASRHNIMNMNPDDSPNFNKHSHNCFNDHSGSVKYTNTSSAYKFHIQSLVKHVFVIVDPSAEQLQVWTPDAGIPTSSGRRHLGSPSAHTLSSNSSGCPTQSRQSCRDVLRCYTARPRASQQAHGSPCRPCHPHALLYMNAGQQRPNSPRCRHHLAEAGLAPRSNSNGLESSEPWRHPSTIPWIQLCRTSSASPAAWERLPTF
ncbi:uncharacterized protein [Narcine bancroftii]|uniref:uncharacterized protein n=1 Tax=Narcine bancroftii TaxID=1343680 RepID=UPI003831A8C9